MNGFVKGGLVLGGTVLGLGALRRLLNPRPRYHAWEKPPYERFENKVLVVGGGFGGYTAATDLCEMTKRRDDVGVLVIARDNFFTFWPMVPGIVSSDIDARNVAQPLRRALILAGASFRRATVKGVDPERKVVQADGGHEFPYDQLIISLGGQPNFFGIPGVEEHSLTMRGVEDAERVRNRVIERFEEVSLIRDDVPDSKLTFVVIGGGRRGSRWPPRSTASSTRASPPTTRTSTSTALGSTSWKPCLISCPSSTPPCGGPPAPGSSTSASRCSPAPWPRRSHRIASSSEAANR